jgi:thiol-disulfide isomerase/thioredoxin
MHVSYEFRRFVGFLLAVVAFVAVSSSPARASDRWLTDYEEAVAQASDAGRPVLTIFTGSDWCPHCKTLEDQVLASDTFLAWAEENVVLLMIDLPQQGISQAVRSERSQVCIKYGIRTFPSAVLIGSDGEKIAVKSGYTGESASAWVAAMAEKMPARDAVAASAGKEGVLESLEEAVATAQGQKRPILLVVSRPGDSAAKTKTATLISDPEFGEFARDNFVVARVPANTDAPATDEPLENLLGGADLPAESVEIIVTEDGQTPLFSQSGSQPPARIVHGLRRFLAARQTARHGDAAVR